MSGCHIGEDRGDLWRRPEVSDDEFDVADLRRLKPIAVLYQAGYLTIKGYDNGLYKLGLPDEEVRRDLLKTVTGVISGEGTTWASSLGIKLITARWPEFFAGLKSLYAHMPYGSLEETVYEAASQRILCTLLASQGFEYRAEDVQSNGRADIVAKHERGVFIFELKVDEPVDKAFAQIRAKGYAEPYRAGGAPIWLVGLSFDSKTRRLVDCAAMAL